ncbi:MAG: NAD(P)-dependent oxidoreductase [Tissierellia bacterium]|nr:NAD(P)-dependent oxidoreductase [Tissierellia bacterium]
MKKIVYSAVKLPEETIKILEGADLELRMHDALDTPTEEKIVEEARDAHAIISGVNVKISSKIIESSKNLKHIANIGAGVNNIDLESAKKRGVLLTNTPGRNSVASTAELALGLILALSRGILKNQELVRDDAFGGWQVTGFLGGHQVAYKKLFIDGFGNIGQEIARMARAFHMDISYYDIKDRREFQRAEEETGARYVTFEEGLKTADYVVLQMNYTPENHHLIGAEELELMKEDAYLINTARGGIVDEEALHRALKAGKIAGAAIDTHEEEPKFHPGLKGLDQVILTPHIGNDSHEARIEMANTAAQDLIRVMEGKKPQYPVEG